MKVLQIGKRYFPYIGGIEQVSRDIANALNGDCEQRIICYNHKKGNKIDVVDDAQVVRVGCIATIASQPISTSYYKVLKKQFAEFKPDIVIFHYPNPFASHYLLKVLKKYPECKLVVWWHADIIKQKMLGKLFNAQNKKLLKRAAKIVATSPNYISGSKYLSLFKNDCTIIPCCVNDGRMAITEADKEAAEEIRKENLGKTILFAMGRHVPYKGIENLVKASKVLGNDYKIFIGGEGPLTDSLKKLAEDDDKVCFVGNLKNAQVKAYMLACDLFCFPSVTKNEAFGIALAEAMSMGKPAITFTINGSGVNYVSLNGVTGLEVDNGDFKEYAAAIEKLSKNDELRLKYGAAAKKRVEENFTQTNFNNNVRELINSLI